MTYVWLPMVHLLRISRFSSEVHEQEAILRAEHECQWHVEPPTRKTSRINLFYISPLSTYSACLTQVTNKLISCDNMTLRRVVQRDGIGDEEHTRARGALGEATPRATCLGLSQFLLHTPTAHCIDIDTLLDLISTGTHMLSCYHSAAFLIRTTCP